MRKILTAAVISSLLLTLVPVSAMAGDRHAVRNRWAGAAIGIGAVTLGGLLLGSLFAPGPVVAAPPAVIAAPPPVVYYSPPPVVYVPPPVVVAPPPPVVYAPAPVVVHRGWVPPGQWKKWHRGSPYHGWRY